MDQDTLPIEIWSQIFWHACVDTGYTGRSISETCRLFNNIGNPTKFRSVALRGLAQVISFSHSIKSLPSHHLRIENMYIYVNQYDDEVDEYSNEVNHLPISHRGATYTENARKDDEDREEQLMDGESAIPAMTIIDVLTAAAPTLVYLSLYLEMNREAIFLPVGFPLLSELAIYGQYNDQNLTQLGRLPTLVNLRKLRISTPYGSHHFKAISAIPTLAPYLTHLRLDRHNSYTESFISTVHNVLQSSPEISPSTCNDASCNDPSSSDSPADLKFPSSLKRLLIHPGVAPIPRCGFSAMNIQRCQMALDIFVNSDSRMFLYPNDTERDKDIQRESLKEWLDRINGELAYWEED